LRKIVPHKYSTRSQVDFKQVKLLEVGTSDPQAIGKKPSAWERTKSAIYNSPSLFARIVSLGRSGNSTSASESGSNTSVSAGILPSLSTAFAPLLPTNFSEPPYSSSRIFAAAEEFLSDVPSVGDSDHSSNVQAGSHIDNLRTSPHSDESIRHSSLQPEDSTGFRALQNNTRQEPVHSFSYRNQNIADQLVDAAEGSIRLPEYGIGDEASGIQLAGGSNETHPCVSTSHFSPFHQIPQVLGDALGHLLYIIDPPFSITNVTKPIQEDLKLSLFPLQPLSREGTTGAYPKHSLSSGSKPTDLINYKSDSRIQLHQYPRQLFTCTQSSRPSETTVGGADGLHLLSPRESILAETSGNSRGGGSSSDGKRSVEFHSIPPVSTVDGVYDKPRFSSLPIDSSPARDFKTASTI
jgi:hypothetical protein